MFAYSNLIVIKILWKEPEISNFINSKNLSKNEIEELQRLLDEGMKNERKTASLT